MTTDAEDWLDNLDPATTPAKDARHLREIATIRQTITEAEEQLRAAVLAARAAGDSWSAIGLALGTSRQAAFQRFGELTTETVKEWARSAGLPVSDRGRILGEEAPSEP